MHCASILFSVPVMFSKPTHYGRVACSASSAVIADQPHLPWKPAARVLEPGAWRPDRPGRPDFLLAGIPTCFGMVLKGFGYARTSEGKLAR